MLFETFFTVVNINFIYICVCVCVCSTFFVINYLHQLVRYRLQILISGVKVKKSE